MFYNSDIISCHIPDQNLEELSILSLTKNSKTIEFHCASHKNALNLYCERLFRRNVSPPSNVLTKDEEAKVAEQKMNEYLEMWSFLRLDVPNRLCKNANRDSPRQSVPRTIGESAYKLQEATTEKIPPGPVTIKQMQSTIEAHEQGKDLFQSIINYKMPYKPQEAAPRIDGDLQKKLRVTLTHPWQDGGLNMPSRFSDKIDDV
uniref:Uncharacterized protein n=1 Tax=Romanomermis culicivorax TaxID=13658 RepID=A0A915IEF5_ROMCU